MARSVSRRFPGPPSFRELITLTNLLKCIMSGRPVLFDKLVEGGFEATRHGKRSSQALLTGPSYSSDQASNEVENGLKAVKNGRTALRYLIENVQQVMMRFETEFPESR